MHMLTNRAQRDESGFTLIELLIVIIVLSILAGVVLFAVGNARDDAVKSSCKSDVKVIETAQEAYKAKYGGYGPETSLVNEKLMKTASKLYDVTLSGGGDKSATGFSLVIITQDPSSNTCTSTSSS
jgi:general secretion pathway protein G